MIVKEKSVRTKLVTISLLMLSLLLIIAAMQSRIAYAASTTVFQDGFESGSFSKWSLGNAVIVQSPVNAGSYGAKATGPNSYWYKNLGSGYSDLFFAGYIQIGSKLPNGQTTLLLYILDASYAYCVAGGLQLDSIGNSKWTLRVNANWYFSSGSVNVLTGHWYFMAIEYSTTGTANLWIDGALVASATGQTLSGKAQIIQGGNPTGLTPTGFTSYGDDYTADTSYINPSTTNPSTTTPTPTPAPQPAPSPTPVVGVNWLHTSGINIYDSKNNLVVWNGVTTKTLFGYEPTNKASPLSESYTPNDIDIVRSRGINFVRFDIALNSAVYGIDYHTQTPTQLNYNPRFWILLDSLVNRAQTDGIWVDINFGLTDGTLSPIGGYWGSGNGFPSWMYTGSWSYFNKIYANDGVGLSDAIRDFWNIGTSTASNVRTVYQTFWRDIAYHYRDTPNVVFSLFNEPQCQWGRCTDPLWDGVNGHPTQAQGAQMYKSFMESTIDTIRSQDNGKHIVVVNVAYLWDWFSNLQIQRPNVVIEAHSYLYRDTSFFNLGWKYNQPFLLGEFGGVEQGLTSEANLITQMRTCNQNKVGWAYMRYNPGYSPSSQTWTDLQNNRYPSLAYYSG
jgi:hypothetical protein